MMLRPRSGLPARMVVGYLYQVEPMDLHAWFEAFVGGRWSLSMAPRKGLAEIALLLAMGATQRMSR
ncbi:MAG TPA: transglutaminase domain-containing protein [Chthoniobacterales bacterium]|nr:transglutaminase domain-containing protein [Chthoniobacterales bacterium]